MRKLRDFAHSACRPSPNKYRYIWKTYLELYWYQLTWYTVNQSSSISHLICPSRQFNTKDKILLPAHTFVAEINILWVLSFSIALHKHNKQKAALSFSSLLYPTDCQLMRTKYELTNCHHGNWMDWRKQRWSLSIYFFGVKRYKYNHDVHDWHTNNLWTHVTGIQPVHQCMSIVPNVKGICPNSRYIPSHTCLCNWKCPLQFLLTPVSLGRLWHRLLN